MDVVQWTSELCLQPGSVDLALLQTNVVVWVCVCDCVVIFASGSDHEEDYQFSGSDDEDEKLLAGLIAEEMGWDIGFCSPL